MMQRLFHGSAGWIVGALLVALTGCSVLRVERANLVTDEDWLTEGDSPQRTHAANAVLRPPLEVAWKYNAGAGFGVGSPLVLRDVVLVATRKGEVHAVALDTGRKRGLTEFGDAIEGSPAIADGMLFVPVGWGGRALQGYHLDQGYTVWKIRTAPIEAGLLLVDGLVVAADLEGWVRAYRRSTGDLAWEHRMGERVGIEATPVLTNDRLVVAADDSGAVAALRVEDGEPVWTRRLDGPVMTTPAAGADAVFVPTTRGRLVALDAATGDERWTFVAPDTSIYLAAPALDEGRLVFGGSDGVVRALDAATGAVRWTRALTGAVTAPPMLLREVVYVGTMDNRLHAIDRATGEIRWSHELDGRIKSPLVFAKGRLVVLAEPRTVYLFKEAAIDHAAAD